MAQNQLTRLWTRDGEQWTVQGDADEVHSAVARIATNERQKWVTFKVQDGRELHIRKDHVAAVMSAS